MNRTAASQLDACMIASLAVMAAVVHLCIRNSQNSQEQAFFLMRKSEVALIKQISVLKIELKAAVLEMRLLKLI